MEIVKIDDKAIIRVGEHFMIIIGEKMYGKFHIKQLNEFLRMFEGKGQ